MTERTSYLPGTPSWIDIGVPDLGAASAFYGDLFGWATEASADPEAGGYAMFTLRGLSVAGVGPQMNMDMPPFWSVYVTVTGADATTELAVANGGTVVMPPMDVLDVGRMAILQDPCGSFISMWQPMSHIGAAIVNEPGTFGWNELATTDLAAATAFYTAVFGWEVSAEMSSDTATMFTLGGEMLCSAHVAQDGEFPAWSVWFVVDNCAASALKVVELGGAVMVEPNDMGFGIGAVVADTAGAVFGLAEMAR